MNRKKQLKMGESKLRREHLLNQGSGEQRKKGRKSWILMKGNWFGKKMKSLARMTYLKNLTSGMSMLIMIIRVKGKRLVMVILTREKDKK